MARGEGACLVCGKSLVYTEKAEKLECQMCHQIFESYACCEDGHYVCDSCHEKKRRRSDHGRNGQNDFGESD